MFIIQMESKVTEKRDTNNRNREERIASIIHIRVAFLHLFAKNKFDPFSFEIINSFSTYNPVCRIQAENYEDFGGEVRYDGRGEVFEGNGIHIAGDDNDPATEKNGWVEYKFNILSDISDTALMLRYADDAAGNANMSHQWIFVVNQAPSAVNLTLNSVEDNVTIAAFSDLNVTAVLPAPAGVNMQVYNNGTLLYDGVSPYLNLIQYNITGVFNITAVFNGNQNYTASMDTLWANVTGDVNVVNSSVKDVPFLTGTYTAVQLISSYKNILVGHKCLPN